MPGTAGSAGPRPLRVGVLGAARWAPNAVIKPRRANEDLAARVEVVAVAARDGGRAAAFAAEWGIPRSHAGYEALLADPDVDAVYNCLPNGLHCAWTIRALLAGKHVLCEKPGCSNAAEAVAVQRAAEDARRVCIEGFHTTCHPVARRARELVAGGAVGRLARVDVRFIVSLEGYDAQVRSRAHAPTALFDDVRFSSALAGGATMDVGCYCIAAVRAVACAEPRVLRAAAVRWDRDPAIDLSMECDLSLPGGAAARIEYSIVAGYKRDGDHTPPFTLTVHGEEGTMRVGGWFRGHVENEIVIERAGGRRTVETVGGPLPSTRDSFYYQLLSFADEVREQERRGSVGMPWDYTGGNKAVPADTVLNMAVVDAVYRAAGMSPRRGAQSPPPPYDRVVASAAAAPARL